MLREEESGLNIVRGWKRDFSPTLKLNEFVLFSLVAFDDTTPPAEAEEPIML